MVVMEAHQQSFFGYPIIVAANDIILTLVGSAQVHPGQAGSTGKMETLAYVDGKPFVLVKAKWSSDTNLTAQINPEVAHYTGQTELAAAIQQGLHAKASGDERTATTKLGRAALLAAGAGTAEATA